MRSVLQIPWRRCISTSGASVKYLLESPSSSTVQSGQTHVAQGWIKGIRRLKKATFFHLDDGSSVQALQVVVQDEQLRNLPGLCFGSAVSIRGNLVPSPSPQQPVELVATDIQVDLANDVVAHPFKIKQDLHSDQYRQHLHLRPRVERFASMMRVRSAAAMAIHEFFRENDFFLVHTPVLTTNDAEGGGEAFSVTVDYKNKANGKADGEFFGFPTSLTVSGQLHLESAAYGLKRVYNFNPAFRAERQQSRRHLSEFWMVEAEMAFLDNFDVLLSFMETMLKSVTQKVLRTAPADFSYHMDKIASKDHRNVIDEMMGSSFIRLPYDEALRILENNLKEFNSPPTKGDNLHRDHEVFLVKHFGNVPVFVTDFPASCKPFYAREMADNSSKVLAADLLIPEIGELFGGSLREHRYDVLRSKCQSAGQLETLAWYLELRKLGCPPSGGFGMGFERYIQFLLGIPSIKDAIPYPRWIDHCAL